MRKLTVKNFSVIKEAELEFGKITVLIGPQASGKSLLCKLAYFLSKEILLQAVQSIAEKNPIADFKTTVVATFLSRFPEFGGPNYDFSVEFSTNQFRAKLAGEFAPKGTESPFDFPRVSVSFSSEFEALYDGWLNSDPQGELALISRQDWQDAVWTTLNLLASPSSVYEALYIPAGRAFFTDAAKGYSALQNTEIDPLVRQFASELAWGTRWRVGLLTAEDDVLDEIRKMMFEIAKGQVVVTANLPSFHTADDRYIPLGLLSSGTQELLPLFNVVDRMASFQEHREVARNAKRIPPYDKPLIGSKKLIYLEEPEANVFPETQYELIRLFVRLSREPNLDFSWVITTHSPYVLTSFNTLIEAWRAGNKPGKREQVAELVPEKYWIDEKDFKAYSIHDGKLESIFEVEQDGKEGSGLIDGDFLDSVSDKLGGEFDKLLDIEYAD
jgi:hypothetical protein